MVWHTNHVAGYDRTLDTLASSVSSLRYDRLKEFIACLASDIERQCREDLGRGRPQLASRLEKVASALYQARDEISTDKELGGPLIVAGYSGTFEELAFAIGFMTYDLVEEFLGYFAGEMEEQLLVGVASALYSARGEMGKAWKICEPYMKED